MSTPHENAPKEKTPAAVSPDDLLPPQIPQNPPVAPLATPVAQPIPVAQRQLPIPQPISPQPIPVVPVPVPPAPIAQAPIAQAPIAQAPVAPIPVVQPIPIQDAAPTYQQPLAPSSLPVAQPLPSHPATQSAPLALNRAAPIAKAIPTVPPAAPSQTPVAVPIAKPVPKPPANSTSKPPSAERPTPKRRVSKKQDDPATHKVGQEKGKRRPADKESKSRQPSGTPRQDKVKTEQATERATEGVKRTTPLRKASKKLTEASAVSAPDPIVTDGDLDKESIVDSVTGGVPSWLVSTVLHALVVVLLSLLTLPTFSENDAVFIEVTYAEEENLEGEESLDLPVLDSPIAEPIVLQELPEVSDPLAAMPPLDPSFLGEVAPTEVQADAIGMALTGREKGMRNALVGKYGGTKATESSVEGGLAWLARNQQRDGSWSLMGPYPDGSPVENQAAATAMALLAFQGAGNTHVAGDYKEQVERGWESLLQLQKKDGDFYSGDVPNQHLYTHGQATIAVCELYGMTKDRAFRDPARRAVDFALQAQSLEGGWRYYPGQGADTSVTGWYVMALQSARMAGLDVPEENLQRIGRYLDSVQLDGGSRYMYQPLQSPTPTMTAEGLLCRQYLGWEREDQRLHSGVEYVLSHPVDPAENYDVYYWYYASQLTHHMEGDAWDRWNSTMRVAIPKLQVTTGKERGSWDPKPDRWSHLAGRLYTTCLSIYSLEVYYRHLPIYTYRE